MADISYITIFVTERNTKEEYIFNTVEEAIETMEMFEGDDYYKVVKVIEYNWVEKVEKLIASL